MVIITVAAAERETIHFRNSLDSRRLRQREVQLHVAVKTVSQPIRYHVIHITLQRIAPMDMSPIITAISNGNTTAQVPGTPLAPVKNARHRFIRAGITFITATPANMHSQFQATPTRITLRPVCHPAKSRSKAFRRLGNR